MRFDLGILLTASTTFLATPAFAQAEASREDEILVVGTRALTRLVEESPAPVDVFHEDDLTARGLNDVNRALQYLAPSFNYPRMSSGPSGANTRPVTLRGLNPDQVLVLVNGKRWHSSSVLTFNNGLGRGSAPVDLNTIPVSAIKRVEILRDGAAAQYGSDAIGGVINITLKSGADTGFATVQSGITERGDGRTLTAAVNHGFALGNGGSLNLTAELRDRNSTNRAAIDSRFGRITSEQGDPSSLDLNLVASLVQPFGDAEIYGDVIYDHRRSTSAALYRAPTVSPVYPSGFVPHIRLNLDDVGGTVGVRGALGDWRWDLSDSPGLSDARFDVLDTVNTSLGTTGPTRFYSGGARYFQNVVNLDISRPLDWMAGGNIAFGAERRDEKFKIIPGAPDSYVGAGAQGFPGYNPPIPVDEHRGAWSLYGDLELQPISMLTVGGAVRHERYSDFGDTTTGKVSLYFKPAEAVAFRSTISTGFRAPSLHQQFFSTVTSQLSGGALVNIGTFAVSDPVAIALGASPLRPERSRNISVGIVLKPLDGLVLSGDLFRIKIKDRIALSETLSGPSVAAVLRAAGITNASQARFFTNALDTTTKGFEVTANWNGRIGQGNLNLTASYGLFDSEADRLAVNPVLPSLPLLGGLALELLTVAQPRDKLILGGRFDIEDINFNLDLVRFGKFTATSLAASQTYGAVTSIDATVEFKVGDRFRLGVGVLNLTDAFPDKIADRAVTLGGGIQYPEAGGVGTNGREFFARATLAF